MSLIDNFLVPNSWPILVANSVLTEWVSRWLPVRIGMWPLLFPSLDKKHRLYILPRVTQKMNSLAPCISRNVNYWLCKFQAEPVFDMKVSLCINTTIFISVKHSFRENIICAWHQLSYRRAFSLCITEGASSRCLI